jgi:hypothetical protein
MVKDKEMQVFSPKMLTWLIAIVVGILLPLFTQDLVINQIANLSPLPASATSTVPVNSSVILLSVFIISSCFVTYVSAIAFQIYFIAKLVNVWPVIALIITLAAPAIIWFALPYAFL